MNGIIINIFDYSRNYLRLTSLLFLSFFLFWNTATYAEPNPESFLALQFNGVPNKINQILQESISTSDYVKSMDTPVSTIKRLVEYSYAEVQYILQSEGYFHAKVRHSFIEKKSPHKWLAIYSIFLGPRVMVKDVHISMTGTGRDEMDLLDLIHHHPLQIDTPFTESQYKGLKSDLLNTANNLGYFEAKFLKSQIEINDRKNEATIVISMDTGERYKIGHITLAQEKAIFDPDFLHRFLSIKEKGYYNIEDVQHSYNDLMKTNYFEIVHIEPLYHQDTDTVDMTILLSPKKPQQYTLGLGYGTDTGPRALLGFQQRYITSTGQYFSGQAQISQNYTRFSTYYVIPGKNPRTDSHRLGGSRTYIDVVSYLAHETSLGYQFIQHFSQWEISIGLNQYFVSYTENETDRGHSKYLMPRLALSYFLMTPTRYWNEGFNLGFDMTGAFKNKITSDTNFIQNTLDFEYAYGFNATNRAVLSTTFGTIGVSHLSDLPPTLRFYAGGINSVRGYAYKSLGPSQNGLLTGGKYLLTLNLNYEHYLFKQLSGLLFYDIGNAYNEVQEMHLKQGAGVGLSWQSPVGPLKIYLSRALSLAGDHWRFDLSIGAFF